MKITSQSEYTRRIERVIAALSASLEQERPLPATAELAAVANFSEFHFMRVYRALAGESLGATVQRLRLARAAHLLAETAAPVSDISGRVGFETPQAFARAFRQHFGVAPSEARAAILAPVPAMASASPASQSPIRVEVVELEPFRVVVRRTEGQYSKLDDAYRGLFEWMARRGVLESIAGIWGVPKQDRRDVPEERYGFDCCLATAAAPDAGEGVTVEQLGGGAYLRCLHAGSFDRLEETHDALLLALLARPELRLRDAPLLQEYLNDPDETPVDDLRTQVYLPVAASALS